MGDPLKDFHYTIIDVDLATARNNIQYYTGLMHTLYVVSIEDINSNITVRFGSIANEAFPLNVGHKFLFKEKPFGQVFISNDAVGAGFARLAFAFNIEIETLLRITADVIQEGVLQQVVTIAAVATPIPAAALPRRINLLLYNPVGGQAVYYGSTTTTAPAGPTQGMPHLAGAYFTLNVAEYVTYYGIVAAGNQDINILEGS